MVLALLLQIATLLPPAPAYEALPDALYHESVRQLAAEEVWPMDEIQKLSAGTPEQHAALAGFLHHGTHAEVRLVAILGAGCSEDSPLATSFWRRAALEQEEAKTIACLLAPASVSPDAFPILAWLATDAQRSLPVRATALARLLDANQTQVWPLVRSILRSGTAEDVVAPGADWKRGGRYELPKRILLLSIQELLARHKLEPTDFEPNAAWPLQLTQLASLERLIMQIPSGNFLELASDSKSWSQLLKLCKANNVQANAARRLLIEVK